MEGLVETLRKRFAIGDYPPEFNPKVHGPYDPSRYYGKADTKLSQVKLEELPKWLGRRNYDPISMMKATSRAWWRWQMKWQFAKKPGAAPLFQLIMAMSIFYYINQYPMLRAGGHRHCKYHW